MNTDDEIEQARFEAIGWAWAEACSALDRGEDPRQMDMAEIAARAETDLA